VTGATLIAFNDNASPADGSALTSNANDPTHSGDTVVNQTYIESNDFTNSEANIPSGQDGKWDFSLIDNGAPANTTFCFRVVRSNGTALDTYSVYPEITTASSGNTLPVASGVSIEGGAGTIIPNEGTTKPLSCVGTVTDADGYADITSVTADFYRTSVGIGSPLDDNDHYRLIGDTECVPSAGANTSEIYTCEFDIQYFADATDAGSPYSADDWSCTLTPSDSDGDGTTASDTIEVASLLALDVVGTIDYGTISPGTNTDTTNQTVTVVNTGNRDIDPELSGEDMENGPDSIPATQQKYFAITFDYDSAGTALSTTPTVIDLALPQRTSTPVSADLYWGIAIPTGSPAGVYSGTNTFTAVAD
jgi:hypothetical protein